MSQLNIKLQQERLEALRRYAARRCTPVSWLIKDYVEYLLAGGRPIAPPPDQLPTATELAELAQHGGAFDWLEDEPELYSANDGEPVSVPDPHWREAISFSCISPSLTSQAKSCDRR